MKLTDKDVSYSQIVALQMNCKQKHITNPYFL